MKSASILVAPSLLSANFAQLGNEVEALTRAGADLIHLDVMDGQFVPNLTFGPPVIRALRPFSSLPFDAHLMVKNPARLFPAFQATGCNILTLHPEATDDINRDLAEIRSMGMKAGIAFNPDTPLDFLPALLPQVDLVLIMTVQAGFGGQPFIPLFDKIRAARSMIAAQSRPIALEVDGGITAANAPEIIAAGAQILVSGSFIFSGGAAAYPSAISALKKGQDETHAA